MLSFIKRSKVFRGNIGRSVGSIHFNGRVSNPLSFLKIKHFTSTYPKADKIIDFDKLMSFLEQCNLEPKSEGDEKLRLKYCPVCTKPHNDEPSNLNTLIIFRRINTYQCFRCGSRGSLMRLITALKKKNKSVGANFKEIGYKSSSENMFSGSDKSATDLSDMDVSVGSGLEETRSDLDSKSTYDRQNTNSHQPVHMSYKRVNNSRFAPIMKIDYKGSAETYNITSKDSKKITIDNIELYKELYQRIVNIGEQSCHIISFYIEDERKLNLKTLEFYRVGVSFEKFSNKNDYSAFYLPSVSFPMYYPIGNKTNIVEVDKKLDENLYAYFNCEKFLLTKMKVRAIGKEFKSFQRVEPVNAIFWGLFGVDTVPENAKEIIITEGEYDAMAAWQETGIAAVSLPSGATSLPSQSLEYFKKFQKIYLWMDADSAGNSSVQKFAKKLGVDRTWIVNTRRYDMFGPKDANDCLKEGKDLMGYLNEAKLLSSDNIIKVSDIKNEVINFLSHYEVFSGHKSLSFSFFNSKLKGLRMGEFTVFTGETGSGKTTFLAQLTLDFLSQGIPTLWGSFEIQNQKLGSLFLIQYSGKNLRDEKDKEALEHYTMNFDSLPLYLMKFHGSKSIDEIIDTMERSIEQYDIQNFVLDNLQFMMGANVTKNFNKFDFQDQIIEKLRRFATDHNVHVTLVIHPRKTNEALNINSIFGSAKASQEADNIFILQNYESIRLIEIAKNRFDGNVGKIPLGFNNQSCRFFELTDEEFRAVVAKEGGTRLKIADIIEARLKNDKRVDKVDYGIPDFSQEERKVVKCMKEDNTLIEIDCLGSLNPGLSNEQKRLDIEKNKNKILETLQERMKAKIQGSNEESITKQIENDQILSTKSVEIPTPEEILQVQKSEISASVGVLNTTSSQLETDSTKSKPKEKEKKKGGLSKISNDNDSEQQVSVEVKKELKTETSKTSNEKNISQSNNLQQISPSLTQEEVGEIAQINKILSFRANIVPQVAQIEKLHTPDSYNKTTSNGFGFKSNKDKIKRDSPQSQSGKKKIDLNNLSFSNKGDQFY